MPTTNAQYSTIVRVDRAGPSQPVDPDWRELFSGVALAPHGRRLAVREYVEGRDEVWMRAGEQRRGQ